MKTFFDRHVQRSPTPGKLQDQPIRQHHHQRMTTRAALQANVDRSQLEMARLAGAKRTLDLRKVLIAVVNRFFRRLFD